MMGASLYAASKTEGEREAVKWVENHKPSFVFNRVVPYWCVSIANFLLARYQSLTLYKLGPRVHPEAGGPMGSMGMTSALVKGYGDFMYMFPASECISNSHLYCTNSVQCGM